jgi:monofunctional biosynthetic peptidoglycan transglycosylase
VIEWGKGVYGAEAAARHYFQKSSSDLPPDEAAFLAAILPNPRKWGRWPPGPYVGKRMEIILSRM